MGFEKHLENGLLFRTIRDEQDIARYVAFNSDFNNPNEGLNTDCLIRHFPGSRYEDYQLIEDPQSGEIVSTTCLIPWTIEYEGIRLSAAQLEQVLTHPRYRRMGLVRLQIDRFLQTVRERSFDLSFIWGIPYYYRQFGYTYCLDGFTFEHLPTSLITEDLSTRPGVYSLRPAGLEDIPALDIHYRQAMLPLQLWVERSREHWRYLLESARFPLYLVEDRSTGRTAGYLGLLKPIDAGAVTIIESGVTSHAVGLDVLCELKGQNASEIRVSWPQQGILASLSHDLGSRTVPGGQWLFHITDPAVFLTHIGPVLEKRLAASSCAGITCDWVINLYRQAYKLSFTTGRLSGVIAIGFVDTSMGANGGDVGIPPAAFTRLMLGYRSVDQLFDAWPDILIKPESRRLLEILFPKMNAYLYSNYKFFG